MKKFVLLIIITITFLSCERDISVTFPLPPDLIVVEGHIEQGQYPYVILTKNSSYFAPTDTATLLASIITNATVVVSDGVLYDTLTFTFDETNFPYFPLVYEDHSHKIIGQPNHFYSLKIIADGQTVTSYTSIPAPVIPDSSWFKVEGNLDSLGYVWIHFKDPDTLGNNYRFMTKRISHRPNGSVKDLDFLTDINSVFDDKIFNGTSPSFDFDRGHIPYDTSADEHNIEAGYFVKGDTVILKFINIDKPHFDFWNTEGIAAESSGNPFASPITVKSNIVGGLGIWGGYGAAYDTIIAK